MDLTIRVRPQGDEILIAIAGHGPGMLEQGSKGHGPRNVDERLRKTYGDGYGLEIAANKPQGAVVTIRIPIAKQEE